MASSYATYESYEPSSIAERIVLHQFNYTHCAPARAMLGWSQGKLSRESGVSQGAIARFEKGDVLKDVTRLALAFCFEAQGLVFFPRFPPSRGMNIRGTTPNPAKHPDFAMIE